MPKKSAHSKRPSKPTPPSKTIPFIVNMRNDLATLQDDALSLAISLYHEAVMPEHFLYVLLRFPKFQKVYQNFFKEYSTTIDKILIFLKRELGNFKSTFSSPPAIILPIDPKCERVFQSLELWIDETRMGYCLPFLCLLELIQLDNQSSCSKMLKLCGIDNADLLSETSYLEMQHLDDLPLDYQDQRTPEEKRANQLQRELFRLSENATQFALSNDQRYLLPEHLLLAFLTMPRFQPFLQSLPPTIDHDGLLDLANTLRQFLLKNIEKNKSNQPPEPTLAFIRLSKKLIEMMQPNTGMGCFPAIFLLALWKTNKEIAPQLKLLGFKLANLEKMACHPGSLPQLPPPEFPQPEPDDDDDPWPLDDLDDDDLFDKSLPFGDEDSTSDLELYSIELVEMAHQGKIDPLIGRQEELDRLIEILHKKRSSNALILGNEGVGKTAVVEGLALRIAQKQVPKTLQEYKIYSLNLGAMVAGTEFRGVFEQRLNNCIKEIAKQPKCFLFIDEIHTLLGAGAGGRDGTLDAGNILKPYLARGEIRCIGATTYDEYQKRIINDRAFARRFMRINLTEPSREETLKILQGLAKTYEEFHKVKFPPEILPCIIELSARFISDKFFPDKAIEVMDECGAHYHSGMGKGKKVTRKDVERVICRIANIPAITVQTDDRERLRDLAKRLQTNIFGQDEAIHELVRRVKIAKAGFQDDRRPLLAAFLCGPSGCGKTELARQLAIELGISFVKLDMSEYSEEYAASRLIGSAPGYVGYDRPGALTEPVIQSPHCLLLLDEIEKAHPAVFNLLLQVLDEGRLSDNKGRQASFRNAIILMTSNAGSRASADAINLLGFAKSAEEQSQNRQDIIQRVMKKTFPPEFRNRIQVTVMMNELTPKAMENIVTKTLNIANRQLAERQVFIKLTPAAITQIATSAAAEHLGGRPVERLFEQVVKQHIVDELLFGKLAKGGQVTIDFHNGEFQYQYQK